jgi:hypothetical protein
MTDWQPVDGTDNVQTFEYSFGRGLARTFAVLGPEGWVVVGPAYKADEATYAALEKRGPVAAVVAPNAFHTMGIRGWHERFPKARLFAPAQAIARVEKKGNVTGVAPLAEAAGLSGDAIELHDMPHYKTGEVLASARSPRGPIWHVTDVIFNWPKLPPGFVVKLMFNILTDSAPGFKLAGLAALFMMKDKRGVYRWMKEQAQKAPPVRVVPSHGVDVVMDPPGEQLVQLLTTQGKV